MKIGYYRTDDSGHNYIIPKPLISEFDNLQEEIELTDELSDEEKWSALINLLEEKFGKYRVDGIEDKEILM